MNYLKDKSFILFKQMVKDLILLTCIEKVRLKWENLFYVIHIFFRQRLVTTNDNENFVLIICVIKEIVSTYNKK
jgi:hypothetical protein